MPIVTYLFNGKCICLFSTPFSSVRRCAAAEQLRIGCAHNSSALMSSTPVFDTEPIRYAFRQWEADQQPLEAELRDSLAALSAFQSHLDEWQRQLGLEREELRAARNRFEHEQELRKALEQTKQELEQECSQWTTEFRELRQLLEQRRADDSPVPAMAPAAAVMAVHPTAATDAPCAASDETPDSVDAPLFGSILQQFGKLRQQRASGRLAAANVR
jgi:hypothetical protein